MNYCQFFFYGFSMRVGHSIIHRYASEFPINLCLSETPPPERD